MSITENEFLSQFTNHLKETELPRLQRQDKLEEVKFVLDPGHYRFLYTQWEKHILPWITMERHLENEQHDKELRRQQRKVMFDEFVRFAGTVHTKASNELEKCGQVEFAFAFFPLITRLKLAPVGKKKIETEEQLTRFLDLEQFKSLDKLELLRVSCDTIVGLDLRNNELELFRCSGCNLSDIYDALVQPLMDATSRRKGKRRASPKISKPMFYSESFSIPKERPYPQQGSCWQQLKYVDFGNNKLNQIDVQALGLLMNCEELNLSNNLLTQLPDVSQLIKLTRLNLSRNLISTTENVRKYFGMIKELDLSYNQLPNIDGINRLWALECLDISHNKLRSSQAVVGLSELPELVILCIRLNPFIEGEKVARSRVFDAFPVERKVMIKIDNQKASWFRRWQTSRSSEDTSNSQRKSQETMPEVIRTVAVETASPKLTATSKPVAISPPSQTKPRNVPISSYSSSAVVQIKSKSKRRRDAQITENLSGQSPPSSINTPSITSTSMYRRSRMLEFDQLILSNQQPQPSSTSIVTHREEQFDEEYAEQIQSIKSKAGKGWLNVYKEMRRLDVSEHNDTTSPVSPLSDEIPVEEDDDLVMEDIKEKEVFVDELKVGVNEDSKSAELGTFQEDENEVLEAGSDAVSVDRQDANCVSFKRLDSEVIHYQEELPKDTQFVISEGKVQVLNEFKLQEYKNSRETMNQSLLLRFKLQLFQDDEQFHAYLSCNFILDGDKFDSHEQMGFVLITSKCLHFFIQSQVQLVYLTSTKISSVDAVHVGYQRQYVQLGFSPTTFSEARSAFPCSDKRLNSILTIRHRKNLCWTLLFREAFRCGECVNALTLILFELGSDIKVQEKPVDYLEVTLFELAPHLIESYNDEMERLLSLTDLIPLYICCRMPKPTSTEDHDTPNVFMKLMKRSRSNSLPQVEWLSCSLMLIGGELILLNERFPTNDLSAKEFRFEIIERQSLSNLQRCQCFAVDSDFVLEFEFDSFGSSVETLPEYEATERRLLWKVATSQRNCLSVFSVLEARFK